MMIPNEAEEVIHPFCQLHIAIDLRELRSERGFNR